MNIRKTLLSGILASTITVGGAMAFAQDSTPATDMGMAEATPAVGLNKLENLAFYDADGIQVAHMEVWEDDEADGVWFKINSEDSSIMGEGKYGVHVHEKGVCDPDADMPFESAGGHFNPTDEDHGDINADPSHAGDLGNLEVDEDGQFEHEVLAEKLTMMPGEPNSLADGDGSVVIIHAGEDDLETNPSGESGDRWACAVVFPPMDMATPVASPMASPEATPAKN